MNTSKISVRYAKALFETALEEKKTEKINNDMSLLSEIIQIPEFRDFLINPVIFPSKKLEIFKSIFKTKVDNLTENLFKLLTKNKRECYLRAIARNYSDFYRKHYGIKSVELITVFSADKKLKDDVSKIIEKEFNTKVELSDQMNPDIIGGFILTVGGMQYDTSVSAKLKKIKKELLKA